MLPITRHIALLLFVRPAGEDAREKKLLPAAHQNQQVQVFEALNSRVKQELAATGLPYYIFSSPEQEGASFGQKLSQAIAKTFALGYERILVVGNDCPALKSQHLIAAADLLNQQDAVLGPDCHGGVYLLGLNRQVFNQLRNFDKLPWQSRQLFTRLLQSLQHNHAAVSLAPAFSDINDAGDLRRVLRQRNLARGLQQWLYRLAHRCHVVLFYQLPALKIASQGLTLNFRGPPDLG